MEAINKEALRLLRLFGNTTSKKVTPSVGAEQEYFLVDASEFVFHFHHNFNGVQRINV